MSDDIRRLSDELARDPSSLVYLALGETLRRRGALDLALKVALRGLERHAHNPAAHDLVGRVAADKGELERALEAWTMTTRIAPSHAGARRGIGYVLFRLGRAMEAEAHLAAAAADGDDEAAAALSRVRAMLGIGAPTELEVPAGAPAELATEPPSSPPRALRAPSDDAARTLFAETLADGEHTALLLDADGFVVAGAYVTEDGEDVADQIGAELSGVRDEAERMVKHLDLGALRSVVFETDVATVAMTPVGDDAMLLLAASKSTPLGLVRRVADRCADRARHWLSEVA